MVQVFSHGGIGHGLRRAGIDDGLWRLHEKERRLTRGVFAHLNGMRGVVPSHAKNTVDGETLRLSSDSQATRRGGRKTKAHGDSDQFDDLKQRLLLILRENLL